MNARALAAVLATAASALLLLGLAAGSEGWSWAWLAEAAQGFWPWAGDAAFATPSASGPPELMLVTQIRAPRALGALFTGALLGLAGALAQGLFRNPLADPYLLGTAAGAGLGVVLVLAAGGVAGQTLGLASADVLQRLGLVGGAFAGALAGVTLTLLLARGGGRPLVLLLSGVVVGILLSALAELVTWVAPEALRGRQIFMLGSTSFMGWLGVALLASALLVCLPPAMRYARVLDALVLGENSAASLGLNVPRLRLLLVLLMALATAAAVAQAGLVAFVGLVAPHLVRRLVVVTHARLLALSAAVGAVLLLAADVLARVVIVPQELPVGLLTAMLGGVYLLALLRRRGTL